MEGKSAASQGFWESSPSALPALSLCSPPEDLKSRPATAASRGHGRHDGRRRCPSRARAADRRRQGGTRLAWRTVAPLPRPCVILVLTGPGPYATRVLTGPAPPITVRQAIQRLQALGFPEPVCIQVCVHVCMVRMYGWDACVHGMHVCMHVGARVHPGEQDSVRRHTSARCFFPTRLTYRRLNPGLPPTRLTY